jgi:hypothetical protein
MFKKLKSQYDDQSFCVLYLLAVHNQFPSVWNRVIEKIKMC